MQHMMIDIETMGGAPDGALVAIGARLFTREGCTKGFEVYINPRLAATIGNVSTQTMDWWAKQDAEVYAKVFGGQIVPADAALKFLQFVKEHKPATVWAYPPQFDILTMQYWFKRVNLEWPFHYRDERCARTMRAWGESYGIDFKDCYEGSKHLPLDDATSQAKVIQRVMQLRVSKAKPK
jgi:exodeoxyribonuclease VIII